jgi:hypothetical protein
MGRIVELKDHSHNLDRSARLVSGWRENSIYQVTEGFIACLSYPYCLDGLFPSATDAREAASASLMGQQWNGETARMQRGGTVGS